MNKSKVLPLNIDVNLPQIENSKNLRKSGLRSDESKDEEGSPGSRFSSRGISDTTTRTSDDKTSMIVSPGTISDIGGECKSVLTEDDMYQYVHDVMGRIQTRNTSPIIVENSNSAATVSNYYNFGNNMIDDDRTITYSPTVHRDRQYLATGAMQSI